MWLLLVVVAASTAACGASPSRSPSPASPAAAQPSASSPVQSGFPPGCGPIDLRDPTTGERVDLTGEWTGSGVLAGDGETAWLTQIGNCVYGTVIGGAFLGEPQPGTTLSNLSGRIGTDFRIGTDIVIVLQEAQFAFGTYSAMDMVIEWDDDGRIRLREDREPGERATRCIISTMECPAPVIWYRVGEATAS